MQETTLKTATDNRLLVIAGAERVENTAFTIIVAHNGREILDELLYPSSFGEHYTMRKISELAEVYGKYSELVELQTDDRELIRLAATTAGVHVRPKRRKDIEDFLQRTLFQYTADGAIYDLWDVEPLEDTKKRSKLRLWTISALIKLTNKIKGERRP